MNCPKCGTQCENEWKACPKCGIALSAKYVPKREYKVVEKKTKGMFTNFTASELEGILNGEAAQGWIFQSHTPGEEHKLMLIFYRELI